MSSVTCNDRKDNMNKTEQGQRHHKAMTAFGMEVEASGFGRVCPGCFHRWSDERQWLRETEFSGNEATEAGATAVRRHACGGEMLSAGRFETHYPKSYRTQ